MLKRCFVVIFVIILAVSFTGCGFKGAFGGKPVPPLGGYSTVLIAPFEVKKPSGKFEDLSTMLTYGASTKLGIDVKDKKFICDQSRDMKPVTAKMKEIGVSENGLFMNADAAIKLAKAFDADIIVVGTLTEPNYTIERSGQITEDKSKVSNTGSLRYYTVHQKAIVKTNLKIIDVKASKTIWTGTIIGYRTYATKYLTGENEKIQRDETMYADVRKDWADNFAMKLYPSQSSASIKAQNSKIEIR
jgi:hypothetical protein